MSLKVIVADFFANLPEEDVAKLVKETVCSWTIDHDYTGSLEPDFDAFSGNRFYVPACSVDKKHIKYVPEYHIAMDSYKYCPYCSRMISAHKPKGE